MIVNRPDVQKVHNVYNAGNSGFNADVKLDVNKLQTYRNAIQIISRYSGVPDGNSDFVDYTSQPVTFDKNNYAYLDQMGIVNNQLHVAGWNATNKALGYTNHYLILFDRTLGHELARTKVTDLARLDVAKVYPQVINASVAGFEANFSLNNVDLTHQLQVISRYSDAANGEGNNVNYWFAPQQLMTANPANQGNLDQFNISKAGEVTVTGWHATDASTVENNRFLILFDQTTGRQVASIKATNVARPDVAKVYPNVKNADQSGFNVTFKVKPNDLSANHQYAVVSRYSTDANGNGNDGYHTDYWSNGVKLNQSAYWLDHLNMTNDGLHVSGWVASDNSLSQPHTFVFVMNNGKEVARQEVKLTARPDVANAYPSLYNSAMSGFDTTIKLDDMSKLNGNLQILLRFTNDKAGNLDNGQSTDQYSRNYATNGGNFDYVKVNGNQVEFSGWHASDQAFNMPYQWLIVLSNGKEVGRQLISTTKDGVAGFNRNDVYNAFPEIAGSVQSGFQGSMTLKDSLNNTSVQLVHRFSDDGKNGEGNRIDLWSEILPVKDSFQMGKKNLITNITSKIVDGKLNVYNADNNFLIKTIDQGTWQNVAYSQDESSINSINGYLSYDGWYRPYGTSQDGKTWYKTTVMDWRPILMYTWPNKDVQAQFIKYFVEHGYENKNYGLTKESVANLSGKTDTNLLNTNAQNLRYVIEKNIAANKGTAKLASDISNFILSVPELSPASELPLENSKNYHPDESGTIDSDEVIFVNNDSQNPKQGNTSYADSQYRLMNRTINNQANNDNRDNSPELLVGNDIDNSNPVVQAENMNWEYFLLNYGKIMGYNPDGNFDGFRVDAADNVDADVLDQMAELVNALYQTKGNQGNANDHLVYNEGYHSGAQHMLDSKGNPELYMDSGIFYTLANVLGRSNGRDKVNNLITNSVVNRGNDSSENVATPNWSFVTNHDQRKNLINRMIINDHQGVADVMGNGYKAEYAEQAWKEYYADQAKTDKNYAEYNVPAQYAILLSNKDTVPQVYYGDLYKETAQYMKEKSMYYDAITTLMKARKQFVSGGQTMTAINDNLVTSVRYGKGVKNASSQGADKLSRTSGMAVVVGNDAKMVAQTITINMGLAHANQQYRNLIDTTVAGLTYNGKDSLNPEILTTDDKGILKVNVKGYANPYVSGYLSVWVPVINANQDVATAASEIANNKDKVYQSNAALDSHMIYEDFSLFQPMPTSKEEHAYNVIADNANLFNELGITDFWMAPAYSPFNMSRYNEGYATNDRYTLGTEKNPTKYGTGEELSNAIAALHSAGLKVQEDIVMNQMIGFSGREATTVTRANNYGNQMWVDGKSYANQIYFAYTVGGGEGQKNYGGKFLPELQKKYPSLFTTKAISTGKAPDPTTHITEWSAKYQNGTSLQNVGIGLAIKLPNGDYAYLKNSNNNAFTTMLPEEISSTDYYLK
nr:glycoside hydrolase family 70 protein [Limosilactobacillus caviae]